jgi:hypothetical protein
MGPSIDLTGEFMFFYSNRPGGLGGYDLYSAEAVGSSWVNPTNIGDTVNGPWFEGTPGRSTDTETLFLASDRSNGYGSYDIYQTLLMNAGVAPASLGRVKTLFK